MSPSPRPISSTGPTSGPRSLPLAHRLLSLGVSVGLAGTLVAAASGGAEASTVAPTTTGGSATATAKA